MSRSGAARHLNKALLFIIIQIFHHLDLSVYRHSHVSPVWSVSAVMRHGYILVVLSLTQGRLATFTEVRSREVVHFLLRTSVA